MFTKYKQQGYSELANHEFKTPLAVHPLFLKSPRRVEALVFLMMIALTAYFLLQRMYRKSLPAKTTPKEHRTTTQTLLRAFSSYMLLIHHTRLGREVQPTRLTTRQREILQRLGFDSSRTNPLPSTAPLRNALLPPPPVASLARLRKMGLVGQHALAQTLRQAVLRDLLDRITVRYHLHPLDRDQTAAYLDFQMKQAGGTGKEFDAASKSLIHDYTGGVPRQINNLATACLLAAAAANTHHVTEGVLQQTLTEFQLP